MRLLTKELISRFAEIGVQDRVSREDTIIITKFIRPQTGTAFYVTEYMPEEDWVGAYFILQPSDGHPDEWNIFDLADLEKEDDPGSPQYTVRDESFKEGRFADVLRENRRQGGRGTGLLTEELKARFAEVGRQGDLQNGLVIAKFFAPSGEATWYAMEYDPEDNTCFGYVQGLSPHPEDDEFGSWSMDELEKVRVPPFRLPIERDLFWTEGPFSQVVQLRKRYFGGS